MFIFRFFFCDKPSFYFEIFTHKPLFCVFLQYLYLCQVQALYCDDEKCVLGYDKSVHKVLGQKQHAIMILFDSTFGR